MTFCNDFVTSQPAAGVTDNEPAAPFDIYCGELVESAAAKMAEREQAAAV